VPIIQPSSATKSPSLKNIESRRHVALWHPSYRLPREILDFEVGNIEKMGVEFRYGVEFGKDIDYKKLKAMGYDAIF
jgi:hypothetical protein